MGELLLASGTVILAFAVHVLVWKIRLPRKQTRAIILIFFGVLAAVVITLPRIAGMLPVLGLREPVPLPVYLNIICFVVSIALAYMITYSAVEVDSPSLIMVLAIYRAGDAGLAVRHFNEILNDALLVEPRIRDLEFDRMATRNGEVYQLTAKGRLMARIFILHRRLLGAGKGG